MIFMTTLEREQAVNLFVKGLDFEGIGYIFRGRFTSRQIEMAVRDRLKEAVGGVPSEQFNTISR